jgi:DNA-binding CsgD family transcriptional regulator
MTMTKRMRQVAAAIALGRTNKEMADDLNISMKTIEKHRQRLMKTFSLRNTADITRFSIVNRIIQYDKSSRWIMEYPNEYYNKSRKTLKALAPKLNPAFFNINQGK